MVTNFAVEKHWPRLAYFLSILCSLEKSPQLSMICYSFKTLGMSLMIWGPTKNQAECYFICEFE
jgi:hypothetical protein